MFDPRPVAPLRVAHDARHAIDLVARRPAIDAATRVEDVSSQDFGEAVAVVSGARVVGLLTRAHLSTKLFSRFGHALYGQDAVGTIAQHDALRVPHDTPLAFALLGAFARSEQEAYDDLIVVDDRDTYVGLLSVKRLVVHQTERLRFEQDQKRIAERRAREFEEHAELTRRFLATITHELRAPVNTLIGLTELVRGNLERGSVPRAAGHVVTMRATASHLRGLVDSVLEQAKLDARQIEVVSERVDVVALVEEVAEATRPLVLGKDVRVEVRAAEPSLELLTDRRLLRQILTNLASNAAKHTESGVVRFEIARRTTGVALCVLDTGPGIPEAKRDLLFRAFMQLDDPSTRAHGGTGLGLSIAKGFADLIGASLTFSPVVPHGACFTVTMKE